jgi:hypothetical protein
MTAIVDEKLIGLWFMPIHAKRDGVRGDWQADLREEEPGRFVFQCRFRWHMDDRAWSTKDVNNWQAYQIRDLPRAEVLAKAQTLVRNMEVRTCSKADEILMDESGPTGFVLRLCEMPWAHARMVIAAVPQVRRNG